MPSPELAIIISYPTSVSGIIFLNNQDILIDLADFAFQEQPEDNLVVAITLVWYDGSIIIAAKQIKSLELHHTMIHYYINSHKPVYIFPHLVLIKSIGYPPQKYNNYDIKNRKLCNLQ